MIENADFLAIFLLILLKLAHNALDIIYVWYDGVENPDGNTLCMKEDENVVVVADMLHLYVPRYLILFLFSNR